MATTSSRSRCGECGQAIEDSPIRDDDPDVREELIDMRDFYASILADSVQDEAWKLFGQMWSPNAQVFDTRPRDAEGKVIREEVDPAPVISRGGA